MKQKVWSLMYALCFVLIFCLLLSSVGYLMRDKRVGFNHDTSRKVSGFYAESKDSLDFVFVGSSHVYSSIAPAVLWTDFGITSYDFASPQQPLWVSYYYIKEILKHQNPQAVVLDIRYVFFDMEYQYDGYTRMGFEGTPFSLDKVDAINASVEKDSRWSHYFDLAVYHSNWQNLDENRFTNLHKNNPYKGFSPYLFPTKNIIAEDLMPNAQVVACTDRTELPPKSEEYLRKIIELSKTRGFELLLIKTPESLLEWQPYYNTVADIAAETGVAFINYNLKMGGSAHLNVTVAETFTQMLGQDLLQRYAVEDKRGYPQYAQWTEDSRLFYRWKEVHRIVNETDLSTYIDQLNDPNYVVLMGKQGGGYSELTPAAAQVLSALDLNPAYLEQHAEPYVCMLYNGTRYYENTVTDADMFEVELDGHKFTLSVSQEMGDNMVELMVDEADFSQKRTGLNIVVYDLVLQDVVDSVVFDIGTPESSMDEIRCVRDFLPTMTYIEP